MTSKIKVVASALAATVALTASTGLWAESKGDGEHPFFSEHRMKEGKGGHKGGCSGRGGEHMSRGGEHGGKRMMDHFDGKMLKREFSADEIRTLTSAKLIMKGNPNVKVGEVKATDTGYSVTIVTQDDSLVRELNLAKNGMELEKFEKIQKHMEQKKQRIEAWKAKQQG